MSKSLLYHYTNPAGLKGIITNQELWATNVWFMNDRGEATFGLKKFRDLLNSKVPASDFESKVLREAAKTATTFDGTDGFYQSYIACLSKKGDLLSQWRAYGKDSGFSLGLDRSILSEIGLAKTRVTITFRILEVSYAKSTHKKELQELWVKHVQEASETDDPKKVAVDFAIAAALVATGIKHPAFKEEAEIRLHAIRFGGASALPTSSDVDFRESAMGITPYIKLPLATEDKAKCAIKEVIVGPQRHPSEAAMAVTQLLQSKSLSDVVVRFSKIPLRA